MGAVLRGVAWQRCRVHCVRKALALGPKVVTQMVAATIRTVFGQPDPASARAPWRRVVASFRPRFPRLAQLLGEATADVVVSLAFPPEHWWQLWSTNPLERPNKEGKHRIDVVELFPHQASVIRLAGAVLAEQHAERQVSRRYVSA